MNKNYRSLTDYLTSLRYTDHKGITFVLGSENEEFLSYQDLFNEALRFLKYLQDKGLCPGSELVFQIENLKEFIITYWACILGGFIPVPLSIAHHSEGFEKLVKVWKTLNDPMLIISEANFNKLISKISEYDIYLKTILIEELNGAEGEGSIVDADLDKIAFIQFSSGSTGDPKGVTLTHGNLLANIEGISKGMNLTSTDKLLSWMPLTHDMGLIGFHLAPLVSALDLFLMPTELFIRNPLLWMKKAAQHNITISSSPNFGYQHFLNQFNENNFQNVELSSLKIIFNGAEPISAAICRDFLAKLKPYGLKETVMFTVYGLAEASLAVTFPKPEIEFSTLKINRKKVSPGERIILSTTDDTSIELVNCGSPIQHCSVMITDEHKNTLQDEHIGFINIKGANVTTGYYNHTKASEQLITAEGWLNTGDLGFFYDGCLYVTGRMKELIFLAGQNVYAHDIERIALELDEIEAGKVVACGIPDDKSGLEKLVLFVLFKKQTEAFRPLANQLKKHVAATAGIEVAYVIPIKKIPKTTSGKIQRVALAEDFIAGLFDELIPSFTKQILINTSSGDLELWLKNWLANRLNVPEVELLPDATFAEQGVTSLIAVEFARAIGEKTGKAVNATIAWNFPTLRSLNRYLSEDASPSDHKNTGPVKPVGEPIAIIGMACRFPMATNLNEFWHLLKYGKNSVSEVDPLRWNKTVIDDSTVTNKNITITKGNYLKDIDQFDAAFFGISPKEAIEMDPQQRLMLELAWESLEHAGIPPEQLANTNTAVYIGASSNEYSNLKVNDLTALNAYSGTGNALSIIANRLSYFLDLRGPSMAVDTACSSSLVALHQACQQLRLGESEMAIAGGVNIMMSPALNVIFSQANMLAADGLCKTFDQQANGYSRGEGAGIVILKRLSDAIRDQDTIQAVIRGSALNQDGKSNGLTAPNGLAQKEVIEKALYAAQVSPAAISYVEAHGTGTPLGDPIEFKVLEDVLEQNRQPNDQCWVGSVKTNIGHLEAAAGMAGLIKTVLSLQNKEIPQHLNFSKINDYIGNEQQSFLRISEQSSSWVQKEGSRIAGVSAFGFGGTNAHVIVEEANADQQPQLSVNDNTIYPLVLSAKTPEALKEMVFIYQQYLKKSDKAFKDICFTAAFGRSLFAEKLCIYASGKEEGAAKLAILASENKFVNEGPVENWKEVFNNAGCQKVHLPNYPFQRQSYWVTGDPSIAWLPVSDDQQGYELEDDLYEIQWVEKPLGNIPADEEKGAWLIFSDTEGLGAELAQQLNDRGHFVFKLFKTDEARLEVILRELTEVNTLPWKGFIYLWPVDNKIDNLQAISYHLYSQFLNSVKKISKIDFEKKPALWLLTKNAQCADQRSIGGLFQSPLWGLSKSIALEYPLIWCGMIDIDNQEPSAIVHQITKEVLFNRSEDQLLLHNNQRRVFRLVSAPEPNKKPMALNDAGTYLITGGLGYLGMKLAKWLALNGAGHIILSSRRHQGEVHKSDDFLELERMGIQVSVVQLDLGNAAQVQHLVNEVQASSYPLKGIFHAAGISKYQRVEDLDDRLLEETLEPKIKGAWLLHEATQNIDLDFFVCFSSVTSIWGGKEQAHYAAANQFLDTLSAYRKNLGYPSLTINLGPVFGGGMAAEHQDKFRLMGIEEIHTESLFAILARLLGGNSSQKIIAAIDWEKFHRIHSLYHNKPIFEDVAHATDVDAQLPKSEFLLRFEDSDEQDRPQVLLQFVREQVAEVLGFRQEELPPVNQGFFDLGMDSISALMVKEKLEQSLHLKLKQTVVFDYPTIQKLVDFFIEDKLSTYFTKGIKPELTDQKVVSIAEPVTVDDLSGDELEILLNELIKRN